MQLTKREDYQLENLILDASPYTALIQDCKQIDESLVVNNIAITTFLVKVDC